MAMEVDLALNARRFQAGTKDAGKALDDLQDVVEGFTRDASRAGDKSADAFDEVGDAAEDAERQVKSLGDVAERSLDDAGDAASDAEREIDDLSDAAKDAEREFKDAADAAKDLGRKAEDAGEDAERAMRDAGEGTQTFKDEAKQNAEEVASSFDGSAESIADGFQGLAASAFSGFGPAGVVAGVAAAAGIGLAIAGFEAVEERQERINELAGEWATNYIESGQRVLTAAQEIAALQQVYTESYQDLRDNAEEWGVSQETAALAMIGNEEALIASRESLNARMEESNAINEAYTSTSGDVSLAQQGTNQELINGDSALTELEASYAQAQEQAAAYNSQLVTLATTTAGTTSEVNEFGDTVYTLPDGHQVIIDAETGQASEDVENVQFQVNNMQDGNVTINAATGPVNASSVNSYVRSNPSVTLRVHAMTARGERIAF